MQATVYCRVSTSGQAENGTSLESQRDACIKLAEDRGYQVLPENVFLEDRTGADLIVPSWSEPASWCDQGQCRHLSATR